MENEKSELDSLTEKLQKTCIPSEFGVSFAGKGLKLDTVGDAKEVIDVVQKCENLEFINFEGNSLGVEAAKEISKALETRSEFKRAIWKDMFTGRLKNEIPEALKYLGKGLITANAHLTVLDLSDNASGPIGADGFKELLMSPVCYTLEELRLNNMGLGTTGGTILASALESCYKASLTAGKPMALKVFVAGRNRLENEGATSLADFFKMAKSLEEVSMPQNGICKEGIKQLSQAFLLNPRLRRINFNDNILTPDGAKSLSLVLPFLSQMTTLDLGDCLLKSSGAQFLATALARSTLDQLEEVDLSSNEIKLPTVLEVAKVLANKPKLKSLNLNANSFGPDSVGEIQNVMGQSCSVLANFSFSDYEEDISEDEDDEDTLDKEGLDDEELDEEEDLDEEEEEDDDDEDEESDEEEEEYDEESCETQREGNMNNGVSPLKRLTDVALPTAAPFNISDFIKTPTKEGLLLLPNNRLDLILAELRGLNERTRVDTLLTLTMEVSSLGGNEALEFSEELYKQLFQWSSSSSVLTSRVGNMWAVHLGLIKNEEKKNMKTRYNQQNCQAAVKNVLDKDIVPTEIRFIIETLLMKSPNVV